MTNKEAIEQLKWVQKRICDITYSPESFEALDRAIKTLEERPQGEWINQFIGGNECVMCSECKLHFDIGTNYCPTCGAQMDEGKEGSS